MTGRTLKHGDTVRTPSDEVGRYSSASSAVIVEWPDYEPFDLDGEGDVLVYAVLLKSGEVRQYSFEALAAANNPSS